MARQSHGFSSIDEYIAAFPENVQSRLQAMRATIREAAPTAEERISYQMPTFNLHGNLVYFAAQKYGLGFYPTSSGVEAFASELSRYTGTKGAVHFPVDQPLPLDLISRIVKFRVAENQARAEAKAKKRGTAT